MKSAKHISASAPMSQQKNVINSIMSFLPDNRPITSLQIVEDYERCPKNFTTIHRTYDQDADADLWKENNILFGKQTSRYLCLSKTEGLPDYVIETLRIIPEKEHQTPKGFSLLTRTADTEQRAWRKKQIAYKLSKKSSVAAAVTDIILCSKLKIAPEGFTLAGEINGILVCYKVAKIPVRRPPPPPPLAAAQTSNITSEVEKALNRINLNDRKITHPLPTLPTEHDYEEIQASYQLSPKRPDPKPPVSSGTLGAFAEIDDVPFMINPNISKNYEIPKITAIPASSDLDYDFQLERQILCTIKSSPAGNLKNPFFK